MALLDAKAALSRPDGSPGPYCFLDFDVGDDRRKLSLCAAFVNACDTRYGFGSSDILSLGGSELTRIPTMYELDHEWSDRGTIATHPPMNGMRVVVELYPATSPLASQNFYRLCQGKEASPGASGKTLHYRGSAVHRVQSGFVIQGGDFIFGNGSGGESVYGGKGGKFKDDRGGLALKHDCAGVLSMGNSGKHSNTSQFFLTLGSAPQCDGKHVVFGRVVSGMSVLRSIEERAGSAAGAPTTTVTITECGAWQPPVADSDGHLCGGDPGAGFWMDVPDDEVHGGSVPRFFARPRIGVVAPSTVAVERFAGFLRSERSGRTSVGDGRGPIISSAIVNVKPVVEQSSADDSSGWEQFVREHALSLDLLIVAPACATAVEGLLGKALPIAGRVVVSKPNAASIKEVLSSAWWLDQGDSRSGQLWYLD